MQSPGHLRSAIEIAEAVRQGQATAVEVVRAHLDRIERLNPDLNAFRSVRREAALAEAAEVDARPDRASLPLAGVPVAVKDNVAVAGEQLRHGSAATDPAPAGTDDELVLRLRAAGAVVVGISTMPELAIWGFTSSTAYGVSRNPWNPDLDPGGSTGGGAIAVATGMAAVALGTDGGGSLRIPAAHCGVVGLKPGRDVVPLPGGAAEHWCGLTVAGPMAGTAADAALAFAVLQGEEPADLPPVASHLRIAVSLPTPIPFSRPDAHQRAAVEAAVDRLRELGHEVVEADPPYPLTLIQRWSRRWWAGIAQDVQRLAVDPAALEPRTRTMARKGRNALRLGADRRSVADDWRERAASWLAGYDAVLTPTVATTASRAGAFNGKRYLPTFLAAGKSLPYCQAWNLAGLPAVSVPIGVRDGLPMCVQFAGRPASELHLLALAALVEARVEP